MTVYVDDMWKTGLGKFRHMKMSHMMAGSTEELLAMADRMGLNRRWIQKPGTPNEQFDVGMGLRAKAVAAGAVEVSMRDLVRLVKERRRDR